MVNVKRTNAGCLASCKLTDFFLVMSNSKAKAEEDAEDSFFQPEVLDFISQIESKMSIAMRFSVLSFNPA